MNSVLKTLSIVLILTVLVGLTACQNKKPTALNTDDDKVSYIVGLNMGKNMKKGQFNVNPDAFADGLRDALAGKQALTQEEIQTIMTAFQKKMRDQAVAQNKVLSDKNIQEGQAFLTANKTKDGVKTTASGLQYKVLLQGKGTKSPKPNDTVTVNYRGTLIDGTEFDSSVRHGKSATFPVDRVIPGWTEALQLMKEGDKFEIYVPANLAYGERSPNPQVGPNSTLIFDIELVSVGKPPYVAPSQLSAQPQTPTPFHPSTVPMTLPPPPPSVSH